MSTTLHTRPPQRADPPRSPEHQGPRLTSRRPTALERLALRLGLLLITYGRRRYALSREEQSRAVEQANARRTRESDWDRARWLSLPPR